MWNWCVQWAAPATARDCSVWPRRVQHEDPPPPAAGGRSVLGAGAGYYTVLYCTVLHCTVLYCRCMPATASTATPSWSVSSPAPAPARGSPWLELQTIHRLQSRRRPWLSVPSSSFTFKKLLWVGLHSSSSITSNVKKRKCMDSEVRKQCQM